MTYEFLKASHLCEEIKLSYWHIFIKLLNYVKVVLELPEIN